ncbi:hypothetical protein GT347_17175 [Xylophilus rhododendri]|uniref:Uncharacterized protein n=1 Tax=Xylophilus rhododendri TaxID=2697032 RepID=A0A857J8Y2_9BURK|nr:hypothetical protein [Xylophilus rhododendri]QHI99551.1 hypothetical protein GT347_17175 [Xylophilus rhododendri]
MNLPSHGQSAAFPPLSITIRKSAIPGYVPSPPEYGLSADVVAQALRTLAVAEDSQFSSSDEESEDSRGSTQTPAASVRELVRRYLQDHPEADGHTGRQIWTALCQEGHALELKRVAMACHHLVRSRDALSIIVPCARERRFRLLGEGEAPRVTCSQLNWEVLIKLAARSCGGQEELAVVTGRPYSEVRAFVPAMRSAGALEEGRGVSGLDMRNAAIREEMLRIHHLLHPLRKRTPLPDKPEVPVHGPDSVQRFLSTQPPEEWFTTTDLQQRFETFGNNLWVWDSLKRPVKHCWVEKRKDPSARRYYFRLHPQYRARLARAAADVDWAALFGGKEPEHEPPELAEPSMQPEQPQDLAVKSGGMAAQPSARVVPASAPSAGGSPVRQVGDLWAYLQSRGVAGTDAGDPDQVREFMATQGRRCGPQGQPQASAQAVAAALSELPQPRHAVLCLSVQPGYLEVWQDTQGSWQVQPPYAAGLSAIRHDPTELWPVLTRFFDGSARRVQLVPVLEG